MAFKVTFFFTAASRGWSESYYSSAGNIEAATAEGSRLSIDRTRFLASSITLDKIRYSTPGAPRDALIRTYPLSASAGQYPVITREDRQVESAINLRVFSDTTSWRNLLLRGLPADSQDYTASYGNVIQQQILDAMKRFRDRLVNNGWAIQKAGYGAPNPITAIAVSDGRLYSISFQNDLDPTWTAGKIIQIRGNRGVSNFNGNWRIRTTGLAKSVVVWPKRLEQRGDLAGDAGEARLLTYTYPTITETSPIGITTRRTGRPSYLPRGRRSVRRS